MCVIKGPVTASYLTSGPINIQWAPHGRLHKHPLQTTSTSDHGHHFFIHYYTVHHLVLIAWKLYTKWASQCQSQLFIQAVNNSCLFVFDMSL